MHLIQPHPESVAIVADLKVASQFNSCTLNYILIIAGLVPCFSSGIFCRVYNISMKILCFVSAYSAEVLPLV